MNLDQSASLLSINPRGERHGDDLEPAVDFRFSAIVEPSILADLMGTRDPDAVYSSLFDPDGFPKFAELKQMKFKSKLDGVDFLFGNFTARHSTISRFEVLPMQGGVVLLKFNVSVRHHPRDLIPALHDHLQGEPIHIVLTPSSIFEPSEAAD